MRTKSLVVRHNTWPAPFESATECAKVNGKARVQKVQVKVKVQIKM